MYFKTKKIIKYKYRQIITLADKIHHYTARKLFNMNPTDERANLNY